MRTPWPLRLSRVVSVLGIVAFLLVLGYVAGAVYYATQVTSPGQAQRSVEVRPGDILAVSTTFNLSDPGPYPIEGLTLVTYLGLSNGTAWLSDRSGPVGLVGGETRAVTVNFTFSLSGLSPALYPLLVNDSSLPLELWVNGTYARLAHVGLDLRSTYAWGAPFEGARLVAGAPSTEPNGTLAVPVTLSFANHASFDLAGTFSAGLRSANGSSCAAVDWPVSTSAGGSYQATETVYLAPSCSVQGGEYTADWTGSGLAFALPGGHLP
jgi:hypothetical protein